MNTNNNEDFQDRKSLRRDSFKQKKCNNKNFVDKAENRDKAKLKKALKSKLEKIKEEEIWEDWENEIY